jgi:uncharacterized HAD superfamily protein
MSYKQFKLGIDIDNTILPETKEFVTFVQQNIDASFRYTDWNTWDILSFVSEDKQEIMISFFKSFFKISNILKYVPIESAVTFLQLFPKENIFYVTARSTWLFKEPELETIQWMKHHKVPYLKKNVILESRFILDETTKKSEIAKELHLDAFFEDNPINAEEIAQTGCPVFLIDYPYNRTVSEKNMYRIGKFNDETGDWIINPWKQVLDMVTDGSFEQLILKYKK